MATHKEVRFSSTTDPLGTKDLTIKRVAAATLGLTVNVVASSAPKKVSLHLDGDDVTGVIVPGRDG